MVRSKKSVAESEKWMNIEYVGKDKPEYVDVSMKRTNWVYSPSGILGANMKVDRGMEYKDTDVFGEWYIFTFLDFINKCCFEVKKKCTYQGFRVKGFYFCSEDEFVVVSACEPEEVQQIVYKVNFYEQELELRETISHQMTPSLGKSYRQKFCFQANKFIRCDGIDYILLVLENSIIYGPARSTLNIYMIHMLPKHPKDKNVPPKRFLYLTTEEVRNRMQKQIGRHMQQYNYDVELVRENPLNCSSCMIRGTKLWFGFCVYGRTTDRRASEYKLTGNYWEIDVTKMIDIFSRMSRRVHREMDFQPIIKEQEEASQFVHWGNMHIDQSFLEFYHSENDFGTIYVSRECTRKGYGNKAIMYPSIMIDDSEPVILKDNIPWKSGGQTGSDRFTLHPFGALLQFRFKENGSILYRVVKCLKINLKSLALIRALFHKNTPIRNHPAYRLCFYKIKPNEYGNNEENKPNEDAKKNRKRKVPNDK